jgi:hypothetical protein
MNLSSWFDTDPGSSFQVAWEDGDRVFYRARQDGANGTGTRFWSCFPSVSRPRVTPSIGLDTNTD